LAIFVGIFCLFLFTGFTAFENIPYHDGLWTRIAANADASRFLRSLPALLLVGLFFFAREAMSPTNKKIYPAADDISRAEVLICQYADTADPLLVGGGDKAVWFWQPDGADRGLVLYQQAADKLIVYKNPVIDTPEARTDLIRDFVEFADELDLSPVFSMVSSDWMDVLHDFGFRFIKFTQEAVVNLTGFTLEGGDHSAMRHTLRNCEKHGIRYEVLAPPHTDTIITQCRAISDQWLEIKGGHEMQFSACYFSEPYLQRHPLAVAKDDQGQIVAFVNLLITRKDGPATIDFMRYRPGLINNLMDFVIIKSILHCQSISCSSFNLGGAALSNVGKERDGYFMERLLRFFSTKAENIYNYEGIYKYKNKFDPEWAPLYIAYRISYDWGPALYANMRIVKPSGADKKRIYKARTAKGYPF
jgi:phosphatidylglycerol lysyltransferase